MIFRAFEDDLQQSCPHCLKFRSIVLYTHDSVDSMSPRITFYNHNLIDDSLREELPMIPGSDVRDHGVTSLI